MNTNLLYIPLRQSIAINLGDELRSIIKRDYFQTPSSFELDLLQITNLRNKITNLKNESISLKDEDVLKQYYCQLNNITRKFPDDCIEFGWFGTLGYGPSGPIKSRSLRIEQLNIIYQLGSFYSQLALLESRYTDEGLKKACSYFQYSAGCFEFLLLQVHKENEKESTFVQIPQDLRKETLGCLKWLMLAQAQEIIWQKALSNSSMKDSVIARLSIQTSEYYSIALKHGNASEFIKLEWINHIAVKTYHFKAAANFRMSIVCQDNFKYGDQVACLKVASDSCDMALKYKKYVNTIVLDDLQGLTDTIKNTLRVAEKDNDLVYLKPVPNDRELKPITGTSMVNPIISKELESASTSYRPLFKELLPYAVIQIAQAYRERQDNFIKEKFIVPIQASNKLITKFLTDRNLPASIDSIQKPENLPESIVQHSQEIISFGGIKIIEDSLHEISNLASQSRQLLSGCQERLRIEADEDKLLRERQGSQHWTRTKSDVAGAELKTKIDKMKTYLDQAKEGDEFIASQYYDIKQYLELYCGGYERLIQYIPNSTYTKLDLIINAIISDLGDAINDASILEMERKKFLNELEIKARDNNILESIIDEFRKNSDKVYNENGTVNERLFEGAYERRISIFDKDFIFLESSKAKQISLENKIDELNNRFVSEYKYTNNDSQKKRQEILHILESVYARYIELISNLNEGAKFYSDFISKGNGILKECDDFVYHRRIEGRELEISINNKLQAPTPVPFNNEPISSQSSIPNVTENQLDELQQEVNSSRDEIPLFAPQGKSGLWNPNQGIKFG